MSELQKAVADYVETAILAFFAPKVLLIQWAAELVK